MYSVYVSNKVASEQYEETLIFDNRYSSELTALISPTLEIESGTAGSFEFTYPPSNVGCSVTNPMTSEVIVRKNDEEVWRGRVLNPSTDFYNQTKIEVEGELTYLSDTYQPQHEYKTETLYQCIEGILNVHNKKVATWDETEQRYIPNASEPFDKTFYVGAIFVSEEQDLESTDSSYRNTDYETTLESLKKVASAYNGYFVIRRGIVNGRVRRYLDFVKTFSKICQQSINFGENLLDYSKTFKMEDLCTVAMPIGAKTGDVGDELYIYRSENDNPVNFLDRSGNLGYDPNDVYREAGVVYLNEAGLNNGDKIYVSLANMTDTIGYQDRLKDGLWCFATEQGTVIDGTLQYCNAEVGQVETYEKHQLTVPAGAHRLRVGAWKGYSPQLKVYRQKAESQLDEYFTISDYPDVDDEYIKHTKGDVYIINKQLYDIYGWHEKKLSYSNLTESKQLFDMASNYLKTTQFTQMTLEVTALDLSYLDVSYDKIWINMNVPIYSRPHGLTDNSFYLPCTKIRVRLDSLENTEYTLGYSTPEGISSTESNVNAELSKAMSQVPTYSDTYTAARQNATAIMQSMADVGVVSFVRAENNPNQISQIVIANKPDPALATQKWVWNQGGFGYQDRSGPNTNWNDMGFAITMDGHIVADYIAAHTLTADQIWGGTMILGMNRYTETDPVTGETKTYTTDGELKVINSSGVETMAVQKDWGITSNSDVEYARINNGVIYGGVITSGNTFQLYTDGPWCTGAISFDQGYGTESNLVRGMDLRTRILGLNVGDIWVREGLDYGNVLPAITTNVTVDGKTLHFIHGILVQVSE